MQVLNERHCSSRLGLPFGGIVTPVPAGTLTPPAAQHTPVRCASCSSFVNLYSNVCNPSCGWQLLLSGAPDFTSKSQEKADTCTCMHRLTSAAAHGSASSAATLAAMQAPCPCWTPRLANIR